MYILLHTAVPDSSGKFAVDIRIPSVTFPEGDYESVKANYGGLKASRKFFCIVSEKYSEVC